MESTRIKYVFLAFGIGSLSVMDFAPNYGVEFYPFGFIFIGIGLLILNYAIIRYRLMDINIALTRAGIFAIVYGIVLGIPFGIGGMVSRLGPRWWLLPLSLMAVFGTAGPFIYMRIQKRVEARLRAQEFKSHRALRRLSHNMLRFGKLDVLLKLIVHYLVKILKLNFAAIYLIAPSGNRYILKSFWKKSEQDPKLPEEFSLDSPLVKDLDLRRVPVVTEELRLYAPKGYPSHTRALFNTLSSLKANIVIPSFLRNGLFGFLVLSDRRANLAFTQEDLNLLMVLSNEAALAIENAQFHEKERSVLVEKSRREALADMAPGASHQFNNRLAAISSSAEFLLLKLEDIKLGNIKDESLRAILKDARDTLELIDKEVYRGKEITSAILKRAKAKVDFQELNIKDVIENAHKLVEISRGKSGLNKFKTPEFNIRQTTEIPDAFLSEALLQDSFYNLLDNACDAIREKEVLLSEGKLKINEGIEFGGKIDVILKKQGDSIVVQIKDNGIGLKKEDRRRLFTPYFTTKATSGKGSGLGLYVIRDFVEMHKGAITCDSEYGKGTTFTVKFPINGKREEAR